MLPLSSKLLPLSNVTFLISLSVLLKLNALAVVVKLPSGVTCIVVSLVEPRFILPAVSAVPLPVSPFCPFDPSLPAGPVAPCGP